MPTYDYICTGCGSFEAYASMADFDKPHDCPWCAGPARRAMLTAPLLANMDAGRRRAHATNERSADSPRRSHGAGCSCCSGGAKKNPSGTLHRPDGSKSFPAKRPWMISH
ncbi:FmdB family zinc ribbon protein [Paracoccus ravus]|uniref:FmdB family zinc ribbon protein n=1 Tax=Paracoccus ravus TaxID=2447760 RepID=UPI00106EC887|nr:zinc ribbon domain-containing protein [Paracoccus ravus]